MPRVTPVSPAAPETRKVSLVLIEVMKSSDASFEPLGIVTAPALVVGSRISEAVNVAVARYVSQFLAGLPNPTVIISTGSARTLAKVKSVSADLMC